LQPCVREIKTARPGRPATRLKVHGCEVVLVVHLGPVDAGTARRRLLLRNLRDHRFRRQTMSQAIGAAFSNAVRFTLVGSITPGTARSS
jgi:hypothetical protein